MIKAVIFDCFGVLYPDTFWSIVNKHVPDWEETRPDYFHDIVKRVDTGFSSRNEFWDETAEACHLTREQLDVELNHLGELDTELLAYVADLKKRGFKTGMLSNIGRGFIDRMFSHLNIADYFNDLVLSSEVGFTKPDREIFEMSAEHLGIEPNECVFTDDRKKFCVGAEAAGMKSILYKSFEQFKRELEPLLS